MTVDNDEDEQIDWSTLIPAIDALNILAPKLGGTASAKAELTDRMRDGFLDVYAVRAWDSPEIDVAVAWKAEPDEDDPEHAVMYDFSIDTWAWRRSKQWLVDISEWRWPSGCFSVLQTRKPTLRFMFEGVHFVRAQIEALQNNQAIPVERLSLDHGKTEEGDITKGVGKKQPGARARNRAWGAAIVEVIRLREAGLLTRAEFARPKDLTRHLVKCANQPEMQLKDGTMLAKEPLGAGTLGPVVTALFSTLLREKDRPANN